MRVVVAISGFALVTALLASCASGPQPAAPPPEALQPSRLRSLDEGQALALIEGLLREEKLQPVAGWNVALPKRAEFEVDLRLGDSGFGIEWVSAQDRSRYGTLLPAPGPGGQLRLLSGADGQKPQALILVLDHESYRFPDRSSGHTAELHPPRSDDAQVRDIEQRLRRDLNDFLEYARSQYRL